MKERDELLETSLKTKSHTDIQKCVFLRNKVIESLEKAKANFYTDMVREAKGIIKRLWQNLNTLLGTDKRNNINNGMVINSLDKAGLINLTD